MEEQVIQLLAATQSSAHVPRDSAVNNLFFMYTVPGFPIVLASIGSHGSIPLNIRQASLLVLRQFVKASWSLEFDESCGQVLINDKDKTQLRQILLELALSSDESKIRKTASYVVSKIGNADFPEEWPDLLPQILAVVHNGTEEQIGGALKLLADLLNESFNDEQFFGVVKELVNTVYNVAIDETTRPTTRALAVTVFRGCFDILEMVLEEHRQVVKSFADETLGRWVPFFLSSLQSQLPVTPSAEEENRKSPNTEVYRGLVALKIQVVKVLMRIRSIFPSTLAPSSPALFSATWEQLSSLQKPYHDLFIDDQRQSRLEDDNGLPYTLDFLVLELLDFFGACLRAAPVKKDLEAQLQQAGHVNEGIWLTELMKLLAAYSQITSEEQSLWNIDVNIFLSEETSITANYTPRTACGDLAIKLAEWLKSASVAALLVYSKVLLSSNQPWKINEAALYVLNQLLIHFQEEDQDRFETEAASGFIEYARYALQQPSEFLRARGYLVAGSLVRCSVNTLGGVGLQFMEATIHAINHDDSDVVRVACIRAMQFYIEPPAPEFAPPLQISILSMLSIFVSKQDLQDKVESDDFIATLVQTIRDAILLDATASINSGGIDLLFTTASYGASLFTITSMVSETFEAVTEELAGKGPTSYAQLCQKVLPMLAGAFRVGDPSEENILLNLAADLLAILARFGSEPLPQGLTPMVMPKMTQILLQSNDEELLKSCTCAVRNMLTHDYRQMFEWNDDTTQKSGLEVILLIIDRLLGPTVDDNAGAEVGGLAAELVEKAGAERLGPYLTQLLRAVASRLSSATQPAFIQSLILVFARLSLVSAKEVVDFLAQTELGQDNGLTVVVGKWLENSVNFAGYDEIRQNVIALSKLFELQDARIAQIQVKGDLIIPQSNRIMTRSRSKLQPDQFTVVSADLKILKVLIEELHYAAGSRLEREAAALEAAVSEGGDDEEWEDDPDTLDLGLGVTKQEETPGAYRKRDDETQAYLLQFFRNCSQNPSFHHLFSALSADEQTKLQSFGD